MPSMLFDVCCYIVLVCMFYVFTSKNARGTKKGQEQGKQCTCTLRLCILDDVYYKVCCKIVLLLVFSLQAMILLSAKLSHVLIKGY